ncbi:MAG: hypothetical protein OEZ20_02250 [candidate division WOR-3 bacterium]|nr:hypothetical protein [candidate division WOR-3 bacterium]
MRIIFVIITLIFTIALVRLTDAVIKRVIKVEIDGLVKINEKYFFANESLNSRSIKLDQELTLQRLKEELTNISDYYLVLDRKTKKAWLKVEDKVIREMDFEIWLLPELGKTSFLPSGILQVIAKEESPYFYLPDFYYELLGRLPPTEPEERFIRNAFGNYVLYLGENLLIHGPFHPDLPNDLVKHNGIIFQPEDLEIIYHSVKIEGRVSFD